MSTPEIQQIIDRIQDHEQRISRLERVVRKIASWILRIFTTYSPDDTVAQQQVMDGPTGPLRPQFPLGAHRPDEAA